MGKRKTIRDKVRLAWQAAPAEITDRGFSDTIQDIILLDDDDQLICWCCGAAGYQEVAHIIPDSKGGTSEPHNLFLLCSECHHSSPDFSDPRFFIKYVNENAGKGFDRLVEKAAEISQLLAVHLPDVLSGESEIDIRERLKMAGAIALEMLTSHGAQVSLSTKLAAIEFVAESFLKDLKPPT